MSGPDDIVARLRNEWDSKDTAEAADEIDSLRARLAALAKGGPDDVMIRLLRARLAEAERERDAEAACAIRWQALHTRAKQQLDEARARIATLEEGLRPFAELDRQMPDYRPEDRVWYSYFIGDLRRAAAILATDKPVLAPPEDWK